MIKINSLLQGRLKKFWTSNSGGVLIYLAFGLPMLLGAMALSVDLGRAFILNTELKDFSDAAALAGAAELDGSSGACDRAKSAATTGIGGTLINVQAFATDGSGPTMEIEVDKVVCLQNLPADGTAFAPGDTALTDADARFIFVSVVNRNVRSGLSRALGVIPDFDTDARSIAGFNSLTCRVPPIFMCNPLEADGTQIESGGVVGDPFPIAGIADCFDTDLGIGVPLKDACVHGRQMLAKKGGSGGGFYEPGNFGLLQPTGCSRGGADRGAPCIAEMIAAYSPDFCVADTVDTNPGATMGPVRAAFNVRFDLYENPYFHRENDTVDASGVPIFPPAKHVGKGRTTAGCNSTIVGPPHADPTSPAPPYAGMGFPRDSCLAIDAATCAGGRFGNGDWNYSNYDHDGDAGAVTPEVEPYWAVNHPLIATTPPADYHPSLPGLADGMTRHDVYRHEIENGAAADGIPNNTLAGGENANPSCFMNGSYDTFDIPDPTNDDDTVGINETDRRVIVMAVVNCREYQLAEGGIQGSEENVPTVGFIKIFLTEPICKPGEKTVTNESCEASGGTGSTQADVYVELNGAQDPGDNDAFRDVVQLYR